MISYKKISVIFVIFIITLIITFSSVYATAIGKFGEAISTDEDEDLKIEGGKLVGVIQVVGTVIAVGMIGVLGIKYVLGSAEQKAEYKKSMIPYIVGAILIFGFSNITQVIYEWVQKL